MKFAFSTVSFPTLGLDVVAARAREWGYDGVEIFSAAAGPNLTATDLYLTDPDIVRRPLESAGVQIACIATTLAMTGRGGEDQKLAREVQKCVDTAQRLGCRRVGLHDTQVRRGKDHSVAAVALGDWLAPLGDYAAERDVTLVVENALSFRRASEMWLVLDRISHPAVACSWDLLGAVQIGEGPDISVPVLNSRIAHASVADAKFAGGAATYCKLGEGDVPVQKFIIRLRGIGYGGYVTFSLPAEPGSSDRQEMLRDAIAKLKAWRGDVDSKRAAKEAPSASPGQAQHAPAKPAKSGSAVARA